MDYRIRSATDEDFSEIIELSINAYQEFADVLDPADWV
jgi:hypothetical protein